MRENHQGIQACVQGGGAFAPPACIEKKNTEKGYVFIAPFTLSHLSLIRKIRVSPLINRTVNIVNSLVNLEVFLFILSQSKICMYTRN